MLVSVSSPVRTKKTKAMGAPVIDLSLDRAKVSELVVKACQEFGFFQVENHGVSQDIISRVEMEGQDFFSKTSEEKQKAVLSNTPFGYGCKNIGFNGDKGELEYILLEANPDLVSQRSESMSRDPQKFSSAVNDYIEAVRNLACDILDFVAEGLWVHDKSIFSKLIRDHHNDSCFRINHYPQDFNSLPALNHFDHKDPKVRIGFGEHSDPQILTILRSNDVGGLQILSGDGLWIPVPPDSNKFCVFVGDAFQALTNGRFLNVRHRALANPSKSRMSIIYFAAPPLNSNISPVPELVSVDSPSCYKVFTWGEYKSTFYSLRLADDRLNHFRKQDN